MKINGQYHYQGQSFDTIGLMRDYINTKKPILAVKGAKIDTLISKSMTIQSRMSNHVKIGLKSI